MDSFETTLQGQFEGTIRDEADENIFFFSSPPHTAPVSSPASSPV
mgnify:CR=1 FL=1